MPVAVQYPQASMNSPRTRAAPPNHHPVQHSMDEGGMPVPSPNGKQPTSSRFSSHDDFYDFLDNNRGPPAGNGNTTMNMGMQPPVSSGGNGPRPMQQSQPASARPPVSNAVPSRRPPSYTFSESQSEELLMAKGANNALPPPLSMDAKISSRGNGPSSSSSSQQQPPPPSSSSQQNGGGRGGAGAGGRGGHKSTPSSSSGAGGGPPNNWRNSGGSSGYPPQSGPGRDRGDRDYHRSSGATTDSHHSSPKSPSAAAIQRLKSPSVLSCVLQPLDQKVREYDDVMASERDEMARLDEEIRILSERRAMTERRFLEAKDKHDEYRRQYVDVERAMRGDIISAAGMSPSVAVNAAANSLPSHMTATGGNSNGRPSTGIAAQGGYAPEHLPAGSGPTGTGARRGVHPDDDYDDDDYDDDDDMHHDDDDADLHPPQPINHRRVLSQQSFGAQSASGGKMSMRDRIRMSLFGGGGADH